MITNRCFRTLYTLCVFTNCGPFECIELACISAWLTLRAGLGILVTKMAPLISCRLVLYCTAPCLCRTLECVYTMSTWQPLGMQRPESSWSLGALGALLKGTSAKDVEVRGRRCSFTTTVFPTGPGDRTSYLSGTTSRLPLRNSPLAAKQLHGVHE